MGCGCGSGGPPALPVTSGDYEAAMTGMPRFQVESKTETDPETGQPVVLSEHSDYRSARLAQMATGGRLRPITR